MRRQAVSVVPVEGARADPAREGWFILGPRGPAVLRLEVDGQAEAGWWEVRLWLEARHETVVPVLRARGEGPDRPATLLALGPVAGTGRPVVSVLKLPPGGGPGLELCVPPLLGEARLAVKVRRVGRLRAGARMLQTSLPSARLADSARMVAAVVPAALSRAHRPGAVAQLQRHAAEAAGTRRPPRGGVVHPGLLPGRGLVPGPGASLQQYEALDDDPQLVVTGLAGLEGEWVLLELAIQGASPATPPVLYVDAGQGVSERDALRLPTPAPGAATVSRVARLPGGLRAARLDPTSAPGAFQLQAFRVTRLGQLRATLRMLEAVRPSQPVPARFREALRTAALARLGRPEALQRLVALYEDHLARGDDTYAAWCEEVEPPRASWPALAEAAEAWPRRPVISVLMPVFNTPPALLDEAIQSVVDQVYPHWELCLVDDASTAPHVRAMLQAWAAREPRVRLYLRERNGHISAASNDALKLASGEWVALLDHDDRLHPLALHAAAEVLGQRPELGLLYTDEDKLDEAGRRRDPYFKCEFNPELMLAQNMVCHLGVYRAALVRELGGFREGLEGSQDWDLALRVYERVGAAGIHHLPRVLYHWRIHAGSTALAAGEKSYAAVAGRRAVKAHLERTGRRGTVEPAPEAPALNRVRFELPSPAPHVTLVIPTRDRADLLRTCVESLVQRTRYPSWDALVVDNGTVEPEALRLLAGLDRGRFEVIRDDAPFNYSALNNRAVARARGEYVCLLNNDIEVLEPGWLGELVSFAVQPGVGAVGARLWYPDGRLQHGGVVLGVGGVAGHAHKHLPRGRPGYFGRAVLHQSFSAVTAACLLVRKALYAQVGGLDESLAVAFNDVDFCLRVREAGYRNVWTPYAELVHHESVTRGHEDTPEKKARFAAEHQVMRARWGRLLADDPAYSPHLSRATEGFERAVRPLQSPPPAW